MNILEEIVAAKRVEIRKRRDEIPLERLREEAATCAPPPPFADALRAAPIGLISEVKRRSPSAGVIRDPFDPAAIAKAYETAGAQAVSCLMDEPYFGGGEADFRAVRAAMDLPMLYKEFVVDPWQIWHARTLGASAVLLIAAVLNDQDWEALATLSEEAGLEVLLEVHDASEFARAVSHGSAMIGINNRNLKTFETRLEHTLELMPQVPDGVTLISESGIRMHEDVQRLKEAGAHGLLVGEHLLRKEDLEQAVRDLMGS